MRRFWGILLSGLLLIGILGVQAQDDCGLGIDEDDCELLEQAFENLSDNGDLLFNFLLSVQVFYGASDVRNLYLQGGGELERDNKGNIESFEAGAIIGGNANNIFELPTERYFKMLSFRFEEDEFAFGNDIDNEGLLIEFNVENLAIGTLFPFFRAELAGDAVVQTAELSNGEYRHYLLPIDHEITESPFAYVQNIVFGQEFAELSGQTIYEAAILVNVEDESVFGTSYRATEFMDGEQFGYETTVRRETFYTMRFSPSTLSSYTDFDIQDEIEDEDGVFEAAAIDGPVGLLVAAVADELSEYFPPMGQSVGLGGISLDEMMGEDEPTAAPSSTSTPTATPTALNTPVATPEGYPCSATIAGEEGEIQRVIHVEPSEQSVVNRAARAGDEFTVINHVDNDEGRWYQVTFEPAADGYVHEDNLILGEDCP